MVRSRFKTRLSQGFELRFCEENMEKNRWDNCTGAAAWSAQPTLGTYKLSLLFGPGDWDLLVGTKGLGFGPHLPPAEVLCGH